LRGLPAPQAGNYVLQTGNVKTGLHASLLNAMETELGSVETIVAGEIPVAAGTNRGPSDRPLWTWFALAGLLAMVTEWYWFNRRPGGARRT
jgi:hypothetical protein